MFALPPTMRVCEERLSLYLLFSTVTLQEIFAPGTDAVIVAFPGRDPVIVPSLATFATFVFEERQESREDGCALIFSLYSLCEKI